LQRDRIDVLLECTIVKTIRQVRLASRQRNSIVANSRQSKTNTQKDL
jgi:hypothetical protein